MFTFCLFLSITQTFCYTIEPLPVVDDREVLHMASEMISRYESFAPVAYLDTSGRYSIGYGTRSYAGETISKEEAIRRMEVIIADSFRRIKKDFPYASKYEYTALLSLYYNCHGGYKKVLQKWYDAWLEKWFCQLPGYSGLAKRRNEEKQLLAYSME